MGGRGGGWVDNGLLGIPVRAPAFVTVSAANQCVMRGAESATRGHPHRAVSPTPPPTAATPRLGRVEGAHPAGGKDPNLRPAEGGSWPRGKWRAPKAAHGVAAPARGGSGTSGLAGAPARGTLPRSAERPPRPGPRAGQSRGGLGSNLRTADWEADCKLRGRGARSGGGGSTQSLVMHAREGQLTCGNFQHRV